MFSLLGAVLAFLLAAVKFAFTIKFASGIAVGSFFVPKGWFGTAVSAIKAKFAKKAAA